MSKKSGHSSTYAEKIAAAPSVQSAYVHRLPKSDFHHRPVCSKRVFAACASAQQAVVLVVGEVKGLLFHFYFFLPCFSNLLSYTTCSPGRKLTPVSQNSIWGLDLSTAIAAGRVTQES